MKNLNARSIASVAGAGFVDTVKNADWTHAVIVGAGTAALTAGATYWSIGGFCHHGTAAAAGVTAGVAATLSSAFVPNFVSHLPSLS